MNEVRVRVPAKINLSLRVGASGDDGYHPLATLFFALDLTDDVVARPGADGAIRVVTRGVEASAVADDHTNLANRAASLLASEYGVDDGVSLEIDKSIPVAGGMAGGSADAAGALLACSTLWGLGLDGPTLGRLGARLGSDVPFAVLGGAAIGTGRGERLAPVAASGVFRWVVALAHGGLSTPAVYRRFDERGDVGELEVPDALLAALASGDASGLGAHLRNDLQPAALDLRPELADTLAAGLAAGALGGIVSGSGPTCVFLVGPESDAEAVERALRGCDQVREVRRASGPVPGARVIEEER